jgi:hypothetical protein
MHSIMLDQLIGRFVGVELIPWIVNARRRGYLELHGAIIQAKVAYNSRAFARRARTDHSEHGKQG